MSKSGVEGYLGVCRSKTRQFVQYRSTATRRRKPRGGRWGGESPEYNSDEISLVEAGANDSDTSLKQTLPPEWLDKMEEIRFGISRISQRLKELNALHDKHLNRPTLDDGTEEEYAIEILTQDITQMFQQNQRDIQALQLKARDARSDADAKACKNAAVSLAQELQSISQNFRQGQRTYLQRIRNREEKKREFFGVAEESSSGGGLYEDESDGPYDKAFTQAQVAQLGEDTAGIEQRDREVAKIVQSIKELGDIFRELSTMVIDQGTMLDRIDYNLEMVNTQVAEGLTQLKEGEKYQRKSRKKLVCMLVLVVLILVFIVLIALK
eukprot:comp22327_c0_seq1/m.33186 comp22327_c0_seq1/g.33186  ORF comp22327_c0_seq1/g.33186 comp22327_c0_seq1/m.33186 type:complete len:324 (-) comp22327_c0_seq1:807-1778(-)